MRILARARPRRSFFAMTVDVIIVGSGQAGVPLATRLAHAGKKVILVERALLGGTCINYGCTPTKTMFASARAAHIARNATRLGVTVSDVKVDLGAVVDRKDAIVRRWRDGVQRRLESEPERLKLIHGTARFVGDREIEVGGQRHRAEIVILDVGTRPTVPPIPGLEGVPFLNNRTLMELREVPRRLIVLGGGYIGCELGQAYRRFGAEVVIIDRNRHLLAHEDPDVSSTVESAFSSEGIVLRLGAEVEGVTRTSDGIVVHYDGEEERGSHLLVAVGRAPNTEDLDCARAGVNLDKRGYIVVDDRYRTSARGVYAVGDVAGGPQFTHSAWDDHRLLFDLLFNRGTRGRNDRIIPYAVFVDPPVARVGLSETEARSRKIPYEIATLPYSEVARAIETGEIRGRMKLLTDPATERVLGASLVGKEAGELIHLFAALIAANASPRAIVEAEAVHPTFAEGVQSLVMRLPRYSLS
jgi:pyruvate/2-oxoglutarate dehydrogenase complex dihydrolipoamide dehydrogenase (E3) component